MRITPLLERYEGRLALAMVLVYVVLFGSLSLVRHWAFHSTALDLGVFDPVLWNTVHGRFMESTLSLERCDPHSFFLDHFSPALLLIVPLYAIVPRPETLIVFQTIALALGAWPIYLLARRFLARSDERLVGVAAYVLSAPLAWVTFYDFHEISLAVVPLGVAMYFYATRRTVPLLLSLGASFLVKASKRTATTSSRPERDSRYSIAAEDRRLRAPVLLDDMLLLDNGFARLLNVGRPIGTHVDVGHFVRRLLATDSALLDDDFFLVHGNASFE